MRGWIRTLRERRIHLVGGGVVLFLLFSWGIGAVHIQNLIRNMDYRLYREISRRKNLEKERDRWRQKVYFLHSPTYLGREGRRMGMREMRVSEVKVLE